MSGQSAQPNINFQEIKSIELNLPPLPEQLAIAALLSSLDDKIDLLHRQNKTLEEMAETLFRQWFVEEAGEDWEEKSLLDVVELVGGGTPKTSIPEYWDGQILWLSGGDIASSHKSFVITSEKTITEEGLAKCSCKLLPKFATVISARGTVGKYALLSKPMAYSQSNYGILPKIEDCFFFSYLLINHTVSELNASAYGSVFDTITTSTFRDVVVTVPSNIAINEFEKNVSGFFIKKLQCLKQIQTLEKLRDNLLPKLMSGEVRVDCALR
jgi:type I restriction enzyme S subunit